MSKDLRDGGLGAVSIEDIVAPGFSTPWDAPTIPPFPFSFRNVEVLTLVWRTSAAAVARVLPPPLEPTSDVVFAHIYKRLDRRAALIGQCHGLLFALSLLVLRGRR
jgi:acetoacetate decarboxylase